MKINIDIDICDNNWQEVAEYLHEDYIVNITKLVLTEINLPKKFEEVELFIQFSNDENIRLLNQQYRQKDKATNVLSFPAEEILYGDLSKVNDLDGFLMLGDIIFSYETIMNELEQENLSFKDHYTHILVHAILHLLGYDHEDDQDAEMMEALERKILKKLDINLDIGQ